MTHQAKGAATSHAAEARFTAYLDGIVARLGHASRVAAARAYCTELLLPGERKSIERSTSGKIRDSATPLTMALQGHEMAGEAFIRPFPINKPFLW